MHHVASVSPRGEWPQAPPRACYNARVLARQLNTDRLLLRAPRPADATAVYARYASDREVTRYLSWPRHTSDTQTQEFISYSEAMWARHGTGHYLAGIVGGFLSLAASVLDGCDGEIARLKYQESALGCWIETFGDYSYYIAIFVGLTVGAVRRTQWEGFYWLGGVALAGTLVCFALLVYLRTRITAGRPDKLHAIAKQRFKAEPTLWSKVVWRISFVATRAAMPYGIFALSLLYLLPLVVVLAAIGSNLYWISLVLKLRHLLGAEETVAA